jgi:hypothetical protein
MTDKKGAAKRILQKPKQVAARDDVLTGFDETGPTRGRLRGFFTTSIGLSLYAWRATFTLGAYGTLSPVLTFHAKHQFFVVSMVVLLGAADHAPGGTPS